MKTSPRGWQRWAVTFLLAFQILLPALVEGSGAAAAPVAPSAAREYVIQVGSFPRLYLAEQAIAMLQKKGCAATYRYEDTGTMGMWYRVYTGSYATLAEARAAAERLKADRIVKTYLLKKVSAQSDAQEQVQASPPSLVSDPATPRAMAASATVAIGIQPDELEASNDEAAGLRLSLLDAIRYSLQGNREIKVTALEPQVARAELAGTQTVYDPLLFADTTYQQDPNLDSSVVDIVTEEDSRTRAGIRKPLRTGGTLSTYLESRYGDLNNSLADRTYKHIAAPTLELQQPLLNNIGGRKEKTAIEIASYQAAISSAELRRKVIEVANRVSTVYWNLFLNRKLIEINRINLDMAEEVHRRESERYAGGLAQQLDAERAHSNAQVRRSTWLRSKEAYRLAVDRLKLLLNWETATIDSETAILPTESPRTRPMAIRAADAIQKALDNRPELVRARQELMIREADTALAHHQRLPRLDAYGRYSISGYGEEFDDAWSDISMDSDDIWEVGIEFEWAIGNRLAKSRYRRKALSRDQASAQIKRIEDDIKLQVKAVLHRLTTVEEEIAANRSAMQAAKKVVEGEFTRFDIGQTSNEELLRAQDLLAAASRSYVRAVTDYNTAIHELAKVQGVLPEGIIFSEPVEASN
ncbi:MAG: TolC family protein [Desulfosarcinaceae bacterium]|nr:TolC family protein [Desulfosarcinaceae bacterium]